MDTTSLRYAGIGLSIFLLFAVSGVLATGHATFTVDDGHLNTTTSTVGQNVFNVGAAFIGAGITVTNNTSTSHFFHLNKSGGSLVGSAAYDERLDTSGLSPGRYTAESNNTSSTYPVDLLPATYDVQGRIAPSQSVGSLAGLDVDAYYWRNGSKIPDNANAINISTTSWPGGKRYRMNTTRDLYLLTVSSVGHGTQTLLSRGRGTRNHPSGVSTPRINDAPLKQRSNLTLTVMNVTKPKSPSKVGKGVIVKLSRHISLGRAPSRSPYIAAPPVKTNTTNSSGMVSFTNLSAGRYRVNTVNTSIGAPRGFDFSPTFKIDREAVPTTKTVTYNVTERVGNVTGTVVGETGTDVRYAVGVFNETTGRVFLKNGVTPNKQFTVTGIPAGTYQVLTAKFSGTGPNANIQTASGGSVTVTKNSETGVGDIGFPAQVYLNGTVKRTNDTVPVADARVTIENESKGAFYQGTTNSNGRYSILVSNGTTYEITARPGSGTGLKPNTTKFTVAAPSNAVKNITLPQGKVLSGWVNDSQGGVKADVVVWNGSKDSYGSAETNANGYYRIAGLSSINYSVNVYPRPIEYSSRETAVNLSAQTSLNVTLGKSLYNLTVNVTNTTGHHIAADVSLESDRGGINRANTTNSSALVYTGLPGNVYYTVRVEPLDDGYSDGRTFLRLNGNRTASFSLERIQSLEGTIHEQGAPGTTISGAYIYAYNFSQNSFDSDRTDANGHYELDVSGHPHTIEIWPGTASSYSSNTTSVTAATITSGNQVNFTLSTGRTLNGTIASRGTPIDVDGEVGVWNRSAGSYGWTEFSGGTFSISGLQDVGHNVWIRVDTDKYESNTTTISKGWTNPQTFNLSSTSSGRILTVRVKNSSGSYLADAKVFTEDSVRTTDTDGRAVFGRFASGAKVRVTVKKAGYKAITETISIKSKTNSFGDTINYQNRTFTLTNIEGQQFSLDVNVTKQGSGTPVEGATVDLSHQASNVSVGGSAVTGSDGTATIDGLIDGTYLVTVAADENNFNTTTVTLSDGASGAKTAFDDDLRLDYEVSN